MGRRLGLTEMFGLHPLDERLRDFRFMLGGDELTPPSRFGLSSLKLLKPRLALETWAGIQPEPRRVPIYNLFNRTQTPYEDGWSVRVTQVEDFRGKARTYDSHNGTDFAIPVGTVVTSAAPGRVARISNEFHRGGLKVVVDHGGGLVTTSNHLGRALVRVGDVVGRGDPIALGGASGVDMVAAFPWNTPHVHFNTWLNGYPVDPFAARGESSMWVDHNDPRPYEDAGELAPPSDWDEAGIAATLDACLDRDLAARLTAETDLGTRAIDTMFHANYYPTRFPRRFPMYRTEHPRAGRLSLPFGSAEFDGIWLPD